MNRLLLPKKELMLPSQLASCSFWASGERLYRSGAATTNVGWMEQISNTALLDATSPLIATNPINGRPSLKGQASASLTGGSCRIGTAFSTSAMFVVRWDGTAQCGFGGGTTNCPNYYVRTDGALAIRRVGAGGDAYNTVASALVSGVVSVVIMSYTHNGSNATVACTVNGTSISTSTSATSTLTTGTAIAPTTNNGRLVGEIAEFALFDVAYALPFTPLLGIQRRWARMYGIRAAA